MTSTTQARPFSQACENNREPILAVLRDCFHDKHRILEIGSGTGQHGVFFAQHLPHLRWQTSDRHENHPGINMWIDHAGLDNCLRPRELDVNRADHWDGLSAGGRFDGVFTANTAHIMHWSAVENMIAGVGRMLQEGGSFLLYGPFNRNGKFTSESNARFHQSLQFQDPGMGIRDDRAVVAAASENGLTFESDTPMPANNRILGFSKTKVCT